MGVQHISIITITVAIAIINTIAINIVFFDDGTVDIDSDSVDGGDVDGNSVGQSASACWTTSIKNLCHWRHHSRVFYQYRLPH